MSEYRQFRVQCLSPSGLHEMAYTEWGDAANPRVLICAHGLSRVGRDFDDLARALAGAYRVVCPDVVGRGMSSWLADPTYYHVPQYVSDMVTLIARLNPQSLHWVGTSMGGLIGLGLASAVNSPIERLVINDVGPTLEPAALVRIGSYMGQPMQWATLDEAADALWAISKGFGPHTRAQWLALTAAQLKPNDAGTALVPRCDPAIALPFKAITPAIAAAGEAALWQAYDQLVCATLVLRGAESDLLSTATALAMTQRGPKAQLHEFAGVGHAPMLVQPEQIAVVRNFLLGP